MLSLFTPASFLIVLAVGILAVVAGFLLEKYDPAGLYHDR